MVRDFALMLFVIEKIARITLTACGVIDSCAALRWQFRKEWRFESSQVDKFLNMAPTERYHQRISERLNEAKSISDQVYYMAKKITMDLDNLFRTAPKENVPT